MKLNKKYFGKSTFYEYHCKRWVTERDWLFGNGREFKRKVYRQKLNKTSIKNILNKPRKNKSRPSIKVKVKMFLLRKRLRRP